MNPDVAHFERLVQGGQLAHEHAAHGLIYDFLHSLNSGDLRTIRWVALGTFTWLIINTLWFTIRDVIKISLTMGISGLDLAVQILSDLFVKLEAKLIAVVNRFERAANEFLADRSKDGYSQRRD